MCDLYVFQTYFSEITTKINAISRWSNFPDFVEKEQLNLTATAFNNKWDYLG